MTPEAMDKLIVWSLMLLVFLGSAVLATGAVLMLDGLLWECRRMWRWLSRRWS